MRQTGLIGHRPIETEGGAVMVRRIVSCLVGLVLVAHLTIFFSFFLGPWRGYAVAFLVGMAVSMAWMLVATCTIATTGVRAQPALLIAARKYLVFTIYTLLAAAFVGAVVLEGPRGWARLASVIAVGLLALATWRRSKQLALKYGW